MSTPLYGFATVRIVGGKALPIVFTRSEFEIVPVRATPVELSVNGGDVREVAEYQVEIAILGVGAYKVKVLERATTLQVQPDLDDQRLQLCTLGLADENVPIVGGDEIRLEATLRLVEPTSA